MDLELQAIRGTVEGKSVEDPAVAGELLGQLASHQRQSASQIAAGLASCEMDVLRLGARGPTL